jgi:hypothetical protein
MKNTTKSKTLDIFLKILEEKHPEMTEPKRRSTAIALCEASMQILNDNSEGLSKTMLDAVTSLESYKKTFRDHIEDIQSITKNMFTSFRSQGFIKPDIDKKTNKPYLKGRTSMVDEMVVFLNKMNKTVMDFYKDVYKIEDTKEAKDAGIQTTLF